jgi:hypothetical protein
MWSARSTAKSTTKGLLPRPYSWVLRWQAAQGPI